MPVIRIPGPLRRLSEGESLVEVEAGDLRAAIDQLDGRYPGFRDRLLAPDGTQRQFVNIYVNDQDVRLGSGLDSALADKDEVSIVPAVAGGAVS